MAQYFISAEDYAIGDGFAETPFEATTAFITLAVVNDGGRNAFSIQSTATNRRTAKLNHGLTMTGFCEVYLNQRGNTDNSDFHWMLFANGAGEGSETGVTINNLDLLGQYRIAIIAPAFSVAGGLSYAADVAHNALLRSNGTDDHKIYLWDEGDPRPATESLETTNSVSFTGSNLSFLTARQQSIAYVYSIGIGTDGDPAPTGPVDVSAEFFRLRHNPRTNKVIPVLSSPTVTDIGANCVRPRVTKGY